MIELVGLGVLIWIGLNLERTWKAIKAIETEMSTARWERGRRVSEEAE